MKFTPALESSPLTHQDQMKLRAGRALPEPAEREHLGIGAPFRDVQSTDAQEYVSGANPRLIGRSSCNHIARQRLTLEIFWREDRT